MRSFIFLTVISFLVFSSCKRSNTIFIYSPDKRQCVTHIAHGDIQFVIDGKHENLPEKNYVIIDVSTKDLMVNNSLNVCWREDGTKYEWQIVISKSTILKSTLDTARFSFKTELPKKDGWIPTAAKFRSPNCASIDITRRKSIPPSKTTIQ